MDNKNKDKKKEINDLVDQYNNTLDQDQRNTKYIAEEDLDKILLIEKALSGQHSDKETIINIYMYMSARKIRSALKHLIKAFYDQAKVIFKKYIKNITTKTVEFEDSIEILVGYRNLLICGKYYEEEYEIINDSMLDYQQYLLNNGFLNFVDSVLFGKEREDY